MRKDYGDYNSSYDNDYYDEPGNAGNGKKIFMIIGIIILLLAVIIGGYFIYQKQSTDALAQKAANLYEMEDYDEAMTLYGELYQKTNDVQYKSLQNKAKAQKEMKQIMDDAKKAERSGELVSALKLYMQIPPNDSKYSKEANDKISSLKSSIVKQAHAYIDADSKSSAATLLSDYLAVVPDDSKALDLYKKSSGKNESDIKQIIITSAGGSAPSNISEANRVASNLLGTDQYITSSAANIRSGPSKASSITGNLHRGDQVHIYDTYVESESRIWCKTQYGWISYNTMNYSIR